MARTPNTHRDRMQELKAAVYTTRQVDPSGTVAYVGGEEVDLVARVRKPWSKAVAARRRRARVLKRMAR